MFVELFEQVRVSGSQFFGERTHGVLRESTGDAATGINHGPYARMIEVRFIGSGPLSLSALPGAPRGCSQRNKPATIMEPRSSSCAGLVNRSGPGVVTPDRLRDGSQSSSLGPRSQSDGGRYVRISRASCDTVIGRTRCGMLTGALSSRALPRESVREISLVRAVTDSASVSTIPNRMNRPQPTIRSHNVTTSG